MKFVIDLKVIKIDWSLIAVWILFLLPYSWLLTGVVRELRKEAKVRNESNLIGLRHQYGVAFRFDENILIQSSRALEAFDKGNESLVRSNYSRSLMHYTIAIATDPSLSAAYFNRGVVKMEIRDFSAAIQDFDEVIKRQPLHFWSYYNRGCAKQELLMHKEAIADFDKAIAIDPIKKEDIFLRRSKSKTTSGDLKGGKEDLDYYQAKVETDFRSWLDESRTNQLESHQQLSQQLDPLGPLPFARIALACVLVSGGLLWLSKHPLKIRVAILLLLLLGHVFGYFFAIYLALGFAGA